MKKILIGIIIVILVAVAGVGYLIWKSGDACSDPNTKIYVEKQYIDLSRAEIDKNWIASITGCRQTREIKINNVFKKVSRNEFDKFLKNYNDQCNNCLVSIDRWGPGIETYKDYVTGKVIKGTFPVTN